MQSKRADRAITEKKFYKLTIVFVLTAFLENFPWSLNTQYCHSHLQKTTVLIV